MVDMRDLKSLGQECSCRFESGLVYKKKVFKKVALVKNSSYIYITMRHYFTYNASWTLPVQSIEKDGPMYAG